MDIFQRTHYTDIIRDHLKQNVTIRGYQSRLAEVAQVHNSYLSRVMSGQVHLTLDQSALLCSFWRFSTDETNYFIILVNLARAGTKELKLVLKKQLEELRKKHDDLTRRFVDAKALEESGKGLYYSTWYYSAIHFLVVIPEYRTEITISDRLRLPLPLIISALQTLEILGLVKKEDGLWVPLISDLHMSNNSVWAPIYHAALRQRVATSVHERTEDDMHFTGLHAMSRSDFLNVKAILKDAMENLRVTSVASKEEELFCVCLDWFKM